MTLVITALSPSMIIMGADSAIQLAPGQAALTYSNQRKVITWVNGRVGVSFFGTFPTHVNGLPFVDWLEQWPRSANIPDGSTIVELVDRFTIEIDRVIPKTFASPVGFHVTFWAALDSAGSPDEPFLLRVQRADQGAPYRVVRNPAPDKIKVLMDPRLSQSGQFPYFIATDGIAQIVPELGILQEAFSKIMGTSFNIGNVNSLYLYVRFLISTVAGLYQVTGSTPLVNTPVQMLLLPQSNLNSIFLRH